MSDINLMPLFIIDYFIKSNTTQREIYLFESIPKDRLGLITIDSGLSMKTFIILVIDEILKWLKFVEEGEIQYLNVEKIC